TFLGPAAEGDLGHQPRRHPVHAAARERRVVGQFHGRRLALDRLQSLVDRAQRFGVETGADAADVAPRAVLAGGHQQRAEAAARTLGLGIADDDELVALLVLGLDPVAASPGPVAAVRALADHALDALAAGLREHLGAVADDVVAEGEHAG